MTKSATRKIDRCLFGPKSFVDDWGFGLKFWIETQMYDIIPVEYGSKLSDDDGKEQRLRKIESNNCLIGVYGVCCIYCIRKNSLPIIYQWYARTKCNIRFGAENIYIWSNPSLFFCYLVSGHFYVLLMKFFFALSFVLYILVWCNWEAVKRLFST